MKTFKRRLALTAVSFVFGATSLFAEPIWQADFSNQSGNASAWFQDNGFELQRDADDIKVKFEKGRLVFSTDDETLGLFNKEVKLEGVKKIRIQWGVLGYPKGADWAAGKLREPISLVLTFGTEKISSGSFAVPNVPYFISFFLGEKEKVDQAYLGNYYKEGGRYFCTPCQNPVGQTVVTEIEVAELFKKEFGKTTVPAITGLAIEIDTRDTEGVSSAFIEKIELLK